MKTLVLNMRQVESLLSVRETIPAVEAAYKAFSAGKVVQPPIVSIDLEKSNAEIDFKIGYTAEDDIIGLKMAGGFWDNPAKYDMSTNMATICLIDANCGVPRCIMDGSLITTYRTAAAGALAASILARPDSRVAAVIGTGGQARMQIVALNEMFNLEQVRVWGIEGVCEYITDMQKRLPGVVFVPCQAAKEAVTGADIIITATPSKQPLIMNEWIVPGMHINAIGCDMEGKQELEASIFPRALVVNDNIAECVRRGDTQHPVRLGFIAREDIHAEIGEILLGKKRARQSVDEITVFDATGMSIQDITTSLLVYRRAVEQEIGTWIALG